MGILSPNFFFFFFYVNQAINNYECLVLKPKYFANKVIFIYVTVKLNAWNLSKKKAEKKCCWLIYNFLKSIASIKLTFFFTASKATVWRPFKLPKNYRSTTTLWQNSEFRPHFNTNCSPPHFPSPFYRPPLLPHSFLAVLRRCRHGTPATRLRPFPGEVTARLFPPIRPPPLQFAASPFAGEFTVAESNSVVSCGCCLCAPTGNEQESGKGWVFQVHELANLAPLEICSVRNLSEKLPRPRSARSNPS